MTENSQKEVHHVPPTNLFRGLNDLFNSLLALLMPTIMPPEQKRHDNVPFDPSRTWAVVIGINTYKTDPLIHAAHDARSFKSYLVARSVSPSHIHLLVDDDDDGASHPTRKAILDALYDLRDNPEIKHGDTIIIWYSGHGVAYYARSHWPGARGRIEALAPVDRGGEANVPDISDRELNLFLADLARSKGNNITVILDCCFGGGGAFRALSQTKLRLRGTKPLGNGGLGRMLEAAESNARKRWSPGLALSHPSEWTADRASHVLIAACQDTEQAYEDDNGSVFASSFIRILSNESLTSVSYRELVGHFGRIGPVGSQQTPAVAGENSDSLIFRIPRSSVRPYCS